MEENCPITDQTIPITTYKALRTHSPNPSTRHGYRAFRMAMSTSTKR